MLYYAEAVAHNFTKMRLQHMRFPVKVYKFLRSAFLALWTTASKESILQCVLNKISNSCCYRKIVFLLKYNGNENIDKATFH